MFRPASVLLLLLWERLPTPCIAFICTVAPSTSFSCAAYTLHWTSHSGRPRTGFAEVRQLRPTLSLPPSFLIPPSFLSLPPSLPTLPPLPPCLPPFPFPRFIRWGVRALTCMRVRLAQVAVSMGPGFRIYPCFCENGEVGGERGGGAGRRREVGERGERHHAGDSDQRLLELCRGV